MKCKWLILLSALWLSLPVAAYNDHRGHNLDSLERVVAQWTPDAVDRASDEELSRLNLACRDLMLGYSALNNDKCRYYARRALEISRRKGWEHANADAYRYLGMMFYGAEQYDSATFYYRQALAALDRMEAGARSLTNPDGYSEKDLDDVRSSLYGSIGNLYNMMDSIPQAMDYYERAGAIFDKHGWNESNSVLYYNIGETWMAEKDLRKAVEAYGKALRYARGDSLLTANAQKGLGRAYMEGGRTWKALRYLRQADEYYSAHYKEELGFTKENYEYMSLALMAQRKQLRLINVGLVIIVLLAAGTFLLTGRLHRSRREQAEVSAVLEETIEEMQHSASAEESPEVSPREREILDLLSKGYTSPQIASGLALSPETVKWYRKKLLVKLDVSNTAELVTRAREIGLI